MVEAMVASSTCVRGATVLSAVVLLLACGDAPIGVQEFPVELPERGDDVVEGTPNRGTVETPTSTTTGTTMTEDAGSTTTPADAGPTDAGPVDAGPPPGQWFQANGQDCSTFCGTKGLANVASPDGAKCTSGENIPSSAVTAKISYAQCFPSCAAHVAGPNPKSVGGNCYADGQKQDGDGSDATRGCFCR